MIIIKCCLRTFNYNQSIKGKDGTNGYTPIRGTDYWTTADINAMHDYINTQIENGAW